MGEPETCQAQKLLPDLQQVSPLFHDVTLFSQNSELIFRSSSLILASVSPMLSSALKSVENEDNIVIIVTEAEPIIEDLKIFFASLFDWNLDNINSSIQTSICNILDLFSIPFDSYVKKLQESGFTEQSRNAENGTSIVSGSNSKSFKCKQCDLWFSSAKLEKRHARTVHSENHPHVCGQCGRRCRGPAGWWYLVVSIQAEAYTSICKSALIINIQ